MRHASSPALVFDLDGTLVDTAPDLLAATNAVLASEGLDPIASASLRHMVGHGARALIEQAFAARGRETGERLPELVDRFIAHYRAHIAGESQLFPGVMETLMGLKQEGARLGVLTNKPQSLTDLLLPAVGLDRLFDAVFGAGRMAYAKPDPRIFHDVLAEMGGPGRGALMIGDSATDVATARAAGAPVILVSYGYTPEPAENLGADWVTHDFADIPRLVRLALGARD